jgi:NADH-quinone oxidoreductase subunit A
VPIIAKGIEELPLPPVDATNGFLASHSAILVFIAVALGFLVVNLIAWWVLRPSRFSEEKLTTYECGENPQGNAWVQFNIRFYVFALIFIVFDVEAVFLLPWAVLFGQTRLASILDPSKLETLRLIFLEAVAFITILVVGLAYVWRKGDLEWVRPEDRR